MTTADLNVKKPHLHPSGVNAATHVAAMRTASVPTGLTREKGDAKGTFGATDGARTIDAVSGVSAAVDVTAMETAGVPTGRTRKKGDAKGTLGATVGAKTIDAAKANGIKEARATAIASVTDTASRRRALGETWATVGHRPHAIRRTDGPATATANTDTRIATAATEAAVENTATVAIGTRLRRASMRVSNASVSSTVRGLMIAMTIEAVS